MVRIVNRIYLGEEDVSGVLTGMEWVEGYCNTADTSDLPTDGVAHGSKMTDVETGNIYLYNESTGSWAIPA